MASPTERQFTRNAAKGENDTNAGLVKQFEIPILDNTGYSFENESTIISDFRGRKDLAYEFRNGNNGVDFRVLGAFKEIIDISDLVETDFKTDIVAEGAAAVNTTKPSVTVVDPGIFTAIMIQFRQTGGSSSQITGGILRVK